MAHIIKLSTVALLSTLATLGSATAANAQERPHHRPHFSGGAQVAPGSAVDRAMHSELNGVLSDRDGADAEGRHERVRTMPLHAGDQVRFGVGSDQMDTLAIVRGPDGDRWEDDDGAGHGTDALLQFTAPEDGSYQFVASTYEPGQTGSFHITLDVQPGGAAGGDSDTDTNANTASNDDTDNDTTPEPAADAAAPAPTGGGQTYGVFVGISHYGGENQDLPGSADDATTVAAAMEHAGWMTRTNAIVLTDAEATHGNVQQAFRQLDARMTRGDTMVFFFDGHGGGDTLELVGGELRRNELGQMLGHSGGRQLIVLDTCHAGGFAPLVDGHANRWGLFSSRADETSETAEEVHAGGWLSYFFRRAIEGGVHRSADGSVDMAQVRSYVQTQYDRRGVSQRQHLVASAGSRDAFALGGHPGVTNTVDNGTAVATREPVDVDTAPMVNARHRRPSAEDGDGDFSRLVGAGLAVAGQAFHALVK